MRNAIDVVLELLMVIFLLHCMYLIVGLLIG